MAVRASRRRPGQGPPRFMVSILLTDRRYHRIGPVRCRFAMKIVCPQCRTAYDVAPAALGSTGRQVHCVRCGTVWFADLFKPAAPLIPQGVHQAARVDSTAGPAAAADAAPPSDIPSPNAPSAPEAQAAEAAPPLDIETVAARWVTPLRPPKRPLRSKGRMPWLAAAIIALAVIDAGLIVGRAEVVRILPQTASLFASIGLPVNLRDLAFKDIKTTWEEQDGATMLVVGGTIVATAKTVVDLPRLRFAIGTVNGQEIYAWTALPTRTELAPGETLAFRTRLASPSEQGRSINIRFFTRPDLATGLR
ncbi:MAG: thioredoxin [Rhizobiales bacterium]|nr:thioredoxin [Hyphomicrobiales bacterium]